ncbi:MAG: polysaccharide lyase family 8 super-sandwich domain-containing protein [Candidatus Hydrogenedentota bacterium]
MRITCTAMGLVIMAAIGAAASSAAEEPERSLEVLRERFLADQLDRSVDPDRVQELMDTIEDGGTWPGIDYEDVSRTGFEHRSHLGHMLHLARAYRQEGSGFHGDAELRDVVLSALDFWLKNDFICDNWWHNEIGTPGHMVNILLLLEPELSEDQKAKGVEIASRANFEGVGARPGGDFVKIAEIMAQRGVLEGDADVVERATQAIRDELRITTRRGIQPDFSFHHRRDGVFTVSYGRGYAAAVAGYAANTQDTVFELPEDELSLAVDLELDGIRWTNVHGVYRHPGIMNREITRRGAVSTDSARRLTDFLRATDYRRDELEALREARRQTREPAHEGNRFFWRSDYLAHQRADYYVSVRMYSSRNHSMEAPHNQEGLKNHHLADGSNFVSRTGREYDGIFPVWDWQKIPGTTVVQKPELPGAGDVQKPGLTDFVGGASDDEYGFAAFDFESPHDPLRARKAWFFFDDEYVCLGAGIQSDAEHPVATTLDQVLLNGEVAVNGESLERGEHALEDVAWIHHNGVGYIFPAETNLHISNQTATGHWRRINHQSWATEEEVEEDVFKAWLDHGEQPAGASYEYIVLPDADAGETAAYDDGPIILENTPELQAVKHPGLGVSQVAFYEAGEIELTDGLSVEVNEPCLVMVRRDGEEAESFTVAEPTQSLDALEVRVSQPLEHEAAEWDAEAGLTRINVDLPEDGYAGQSVVFEF